MAADDYPACKHTRRQKPDMIIDEEFTKSISEEYRTLPIFEKSIFEHMYKNYYSFENNEYLRCRWREYVKKFENRVFTPFQFVDRRDFHFYNGYIRLVPSASIHKNADFRLKMKPGPGVDAIGELPIPDEFIMKRGEKFSSRPVPLHKRKGKQVSLEENQ